MNSSGGGQGLSTTQPEIQNFFFLIVLCLMLFWVYRLLRQLLILRELRVAIAENQVPPPFSCARLLACPLEKRLLSHILLQQTPDGSSTGLSQQSCSVCARESLAPDSVAFCSSNVPIQQR